MYGDPDVLRSRVGALREQAVDVRALADHLIAQTDQIRTAWTGRAADAMRQRVGDRAGHLRAAATQHDVAADRLEAHVHQVELLQESIAAVERRVAELVAEAADRQARRDPDLPPAGELDGELDGELNGELSAEAEDDRVLLAFVGPPPGHRDWLVVEVPGL
jgi:uncharacterized protein YukE